MLNIVAIIDPDFYTHQLTGFLANSLTQALQGQNDPMQRKIICTNHFKDNFRNPVRPGAFMPSPSPYFLPEYYAALVFEKTGERPSDPLGYFIQHNSQELISPSPYLDIDYYSAVYDIEPSRVLEHFFTKGLAAGYNPSPYFFVDFYIQIARKAGREIQIANAMTDFIQIGEQAGLSPTPIFDTQFYCLLTDVPQSIALRQFITEGIIKGWNPSSIFDISHCAKIMGVTYDQTVRAFFTTGLEQGINPSLFFEIDYYIQTVNALSPDATPINVSNALGHYQLTGKAAGISFSPWVDLDYCQKVYPSTQGQELDDFILYGEKNGQSLLPFFNVDDYTNQLSPSDQKMIRDGDISAIRHFFSIGISLSISSGISPSLLIDLGYYSSVAAIDIENTIEVPFRDLITRGAAANISALPIFNPTYFANQRSSDGMEQISEKISTANTNAYRYYLMSMQGAYPSEATIDPSIYFSVKYYASAAGVPQEKAVKHFLSEGAQRSVSPSIYFNIPYYVKIANVHPVDALSDFLTRGATLGFNPTFFFDVLFYTGLINAQPNAPAPPLTPQKALENFVANLNRTPFLIPSPFVDNPYYDSSTTYLNLLTNGMTRGQEPFSLLQRSYYASLAQVPEDEALNHLILHGAKANINPTYFFNADYYLQQLKANKNDLVAIQAVQDINQGLTTPLRHYLMTGEKKGYNPCVIFDSPYYQNAFQAAHLQLSVNQSYLSYFILHQNDASQPSPFLLFDILYYIEQAGVSAQNAAEHFLLEGMALGLNPSIWFDTSYYVQQTSVKREDAFTNFLSTGERAGISSSPFFDIQYYTLQLPPDIQAKINNHEESALRYYLLSVRNNPQPIPTPFFDVTFYCEQVPELLPENALTNFFETGEEEGKNPSPYFDQPYYESQLSPDQLLLIRSGAISAIRHYLSFGKQQGLSPSPYFDPKYYADNVSKATNGKVTITPQQAIETYFLDHLKPPADRINCSPSPLFDSIYYYEKYKSSNNQEPHFIQNDCFELFYHYITKGVEKEYEPSPFISIPFYQQAYHVKKNIVRNFLVKGIFEGKNPSPYFHTLFYVTTVSRTRPIRNQDSLRDFVLSGINQKYNPSPYFFPQDYIDQVNATLIAPELPITLDSALRDYRLKRFNNSKINPSTFFETAYYLQQVQYNSPMIYDDIVNSRISPVEDFVLRGEKKGLDPCFLFEVIYYGKQVHKKQDLLCDYLLTGSRLKLDTSPFFNAVFYEKKLKKAKELPDLTQQSLLYYFLTQGEKNNDSPSIVFEAAFYTKQLPPDIQEKINPTQPTDPTQPKKIPEISAIRYMLTEELTDQFEPNPFFAPGYYKKQLSSSELKQFQENEKAIRHYLLSIAQHNTSYFFDNTYYLQQVPKSLLKSFTKGHLRPLVHFLEYGEHLQYNPFPFFDRHYYERVFAEAQDPDFQTIQAQVKNKESSWVRDFIINGIKKYDPSFFFNSQCFIAQLAQQRRTIPSDKFPLKYFLENEDIPNGNLSGCYVLDLKFYGRQKISPNLAAAEDAKRKQLSLPRHFLLYGEPANLSPICFLSQPYYISQLDIESQAEMETKKLSWVRYFLLYGDQKPDNPGPFYDVTYVANQMNQRDVLPATQFILFLSSYESKGMSCSPYIDVAFILSQIDKKAATVTADPTTYTSNIIKILQNISVVRYFINNNGHDYQPSPFVDKYYYLLPDSAPSDQCTYYTLLLDFLFDHKLNTQQNPKITPFYDETFYLSQLSIPMRQAWMQSKESSFYHFLTIGLFAGISSTPIFETEFYAQQLYKAEKNAEENSQESSSSNQQLSDQQKLCKEIIQAIEAGTTGAIREFLIHGDQLNYNPSPFFLMDFYAQLVKNSLDKNKASSPLPNGTVALVRFFLIQLESSIVPRSDDNLTQISLYSPAPFVDMEYYATTYLKNNKKNHSSQKSNKKHSQKIDSYASALRLFVTTGQYRGDLPSALFFPQYYIEQLPEADAERIISGEISAIRHYLLEGQKSIIPTPFVERDYYLENLKVANISSPFSDTQDPESMLLYFYNYLTGQKNVDTTPFFNDAYYENLKEKYEKKTISSNKRLSGMTLSDLNEFLAKTQKQGINPSVYFDVRYYSVKYGVPTQHALQDFLTRGQALKLDPSPFFTADSVPKNSKLTKHQAQLIKKIHKWQNTFGYKLPFIADWLMVEESITLQFSYSDDLPFIYNLSLVETADTSKTIDPQLYYQAYPAYVSLYQAYQRLSAVRKTISNSVTVSISSKVLLELDTIPPSSVLTTALSKLKSMDAIIILWQIDSASSVISLSNNQFSAILQNNTQDMVPGPIADIYEPFADSILWELPLNPLSTNTDTINTLYNNAELIVGNVSLNYLNAYQTLSPYKQYSTNQKVPTNYQQIFGSLDYYNTNSNATTLSAAAYFERLFRLTINNQSTATPGWFPQSLLDTTYATLLERRPDLYEIPLNADHTFDNVVYLNLVNYALERQFMRIHTPVIPFIMTDSYEDNMKVCEEMTFETLIPESYDPKNLPNALFNPPCMLPLESSRIYLEKLGTSFFEFYSAMDTRQNFVEKFDDNNIALEYLSISMPEIQWLTMVVGSMGEEKSSSEANDNALLSRFVIKGSENNSFFNSIISSGRPFSCKAKDFYTFIQSDKQSLHQLIPYTEEITEENYTQYKNQYICFEDDFDPISIEVNYDYKVEVIRNLTLDRLKKIALSCFFAKKLNCTVLDIQQPLGLLNISTDTIEHNVKTLALFQWISKTSKQSLSSVMQSFCPLTEYRYTQLFENILKSTRTTIYPFSEYQIRNALKQLLNVSINENGSLTTELSPQNFSTLQSVVMILKITFTDFGLLINDALINKFEQNGAVMNWFLLVVSTARLCGLSVENLFELYHILVGNEASAYPTLLEGLYGYLVGENHSTNEYIYKVSMLYSNALWFQQNKLSVNDISNLMFPPANNSFNYANNNEKMAQLSQDVQGLLAATIQQLKTSINTSAALNTNTLSQLDFQLCQKLGDYFSVDFQILVKIFNDLIPPNSTENNVMAFVCNNGTFITLNANMDPNALKATLDVDIMLSLQGLMQLVALFQLSATDVPVLMNVSNLAKKNNKITFSLSLSALKTLAQLKNLQRGFKDNTNQFLTYYNILTTSNASTNALFLSYANWDKKTYNALSKRLPFPTSPSTDSKVEAENTELHGTTSAGITFDFKTENPQNDGTRGFSAINATPNQVVNYLLTLSGDTLSRQKLSPEIQEAFELGQIETKEWDILNHMTGSSKSDLDQAKAIYCSKQNVFRYYVNTLKTSLWLGSRSAALYLNGQNVSVYLWKPDATLSNRALHCIDDFLLSNTQASVHVMESNISVRLDVIKKLQDITNTQDPRYYFLFNAQKESASALYYLNTQGKLISVKIDNMIAFSTALKTKLGKATTIYLDEQEIETLILADGGQAPDPSHCFDILTPTAILDNGPNLSLMITQIAWLRQLYAVIKKLNNDVSIFDFVYDRLKDNKEPFENYYLAHEIFKNALYSLIQNTMLDGDKVLYELSRKIESRKRDTLVTAVLNICNANPSISSGPEDVFGNKQNTSLLSASDLSAYLLLEVNMESVWDTSPIVEANNSLQEMFNRCRMGNESSINISGIPDQYWSWLSSYRLWQANRKVLIYPENYIEPDLRDQKSPEFDSFTQTIAQSSLDSVTINNAFKSYFNQAKKLSGLTYVDACQGDGNTIYLFASMTTSSSIDYYYRTVSYTPDSTTNDVDEDSMQWGYWNKINVPIHAHLISPVYANGRLCIFWVEVKYNQFKSDHVEPNSSQTTIAGTTGYTTLLNYRIVYTYQNIDSSWEMPTTILKQDNWDLRALFNSQDYSSQGPEVVYIDNECVVFGIYNYDASKNNFKGDNWIVDSYKKPYLYWIRLNKLNVTMQGNSISIQYPGTEWPAPSNWSCQSSEGTTIVPTVQAICYTLNDNFELSVPTYQSVNVMSDQYNQLMAPKYQGDNQSQTIPAYTKQANDNPFNGIFFPTLSNFVYPKLSPHFSTIDYTAIGLTVDSTKDKFQYASLIHVKNNSSNVQILGMSDADYLIFPTKAGKYHYISLSSFYAMKALGQNLISKNVNALVTLINNPNQNNLEEDFKAVYNPTEKVIYRADRTINFNGAFGPYYWEAFFFMPFYIANMLSTSASSYNQQSSRLPYQNFSDARDWYHCIFSPYSQSNTQLFRFPPFQSLNATLNLTTFRQILSDSDKYPFDPHIIARTRPIAYEKTVVMHYIKNMLSWGDALFTQDTRESITEALNLYHLANNLLGHQPEPLGRVSKQQSVAMTDYFGESAIIQSNNYRLAAFTSDTLGIFKYLETCFSQVIAEFKTTRYLQEANFYALNPYFNIPENTNFIGYWGQVSDRLSKIYKSENINGIKQSLALFSPELDPMALVKAAASGNLSNAIALGDDNSPIPIYRFNTLIEYAKNFVNQVIQLGNSFLGILERRDSEKYSLMMNSHQTALLNLITQGKLNQINAAQYEVQQATDTIQSITNRLNFYNDLVNVNVSPKEIAAQTLKLSGQAISASSAVCHALAGALSTLPDAQIGYAGGLGPMITAMLKSEQLSAPSSSLGLVLQITGDVLNLTGEAVMVSSEYDRRLQQWQREQQQANDDLSVAQDTLNAANMRLQALQNEYGAHQLTIQQQQEITQFYQDKFGTEALYNWMITTLTPLHQNAYNLAVRLALKAQKAYHYELPHDSTAYISPSPYNINYKGQLSGETLLSQLGFLEEAYLNNNERLFEAEKIISLKTIALNKLTEFQNSGSTTFQIDESLFEQDYKDFTNRRIQYIDVSIPSLTGPYQTLNLILSRTDLEKDPKYIGIKCEMLICTGVHDTGMSISGSDGRRRLFEGTPVQSTWHLRVGNIDEFEKNPDYHASIQTVSDVLIKISYSAYSGKPSNNSNNNANNSMPPADYSNADLSKNEAFANTYERRSASVKDTFSAKAPPSYLTNYGRFKTNNTKSVPPELSSYNTASPQNNGRK